VSTELVSQLLGTFLGGNVDSIAGLTSQNTGFLSGRALSDEEMAEYYVNHSLDASALQWEDISFSENIIHVHQTMQRIQCNEDNTKTKIIITTPKSPCSIRCIPIPSELVSIIQMHKQCSHGFVLTNSVQQYIEPRTMQNRFKYALEQASIDTANYHALRHTFATRCIELGFDVKSLSEILGHATVNITMNRYVHPSMELKKENMQRLSSLFPVK